jgi:hypothetical protein
VPRLPVDGNKVVEHRITLGTKERQMLESALIGYNFNRISTPIVAGVSDVSFMLVVASLLTAFFPNIVIPTGVEQVDEITKAIVDGIRQAGADGFGGLEYGLGPIDTPRSLANLLIELLGGNLDE